MVKTTFFQILPVLALSVVIFFAIASMYFNRLKPRDKIILRIHFVLFISLLIIIAIKFLEEQTWGQIIWIFAFLGLNAFSWIIHDATPKQSKK